LRLALGRLEIAAALKGHNPVVEPQGVVLFGLVIRIAIRRSGCGETRGQRGSEKHLSHSRTMRRDAAIFNISRGFGGWLSDNEAPLLLVGRGATQVRDTSAG